MTSAKIKSRKVTETKNQIKGIFYLTDKTRTRFEIDKKTGDWSQWGNCTDNLCLSVPIIERMLNEMY
jgi:hypothetical protein